MSWYRLVISHEDAVRGKFELVHEMIATRHKAAGAPIGIFMYGMSICSMKQTIGTDSTYYFPPGLYPPNAENKQRYEASKLARKNSD